MVVTSAKAKKASFLESGMLSVPLHQLLATEEFCFL